MLNLRGSLLLLATTEPGPLDANGNPTRKPKELPTYDVMFSPEEYAAQADENGVNPLDQYRYTPAYADNCWAGLGNYSPLDTTVYVRFPTQAEAEAGLQKWIEPTNWHENPVMKGDVREHNGKKWTSLIDYNVWEPGLSGWREVVATGYPTWVQPTGSHDAYAKGDRVRFQGADYESLIAANVWSPTAYPAGWKKL